MRLLWITDPWDTLDHARDTTLRLAAEADKMGHSSFWCDVRSLRLDRGQLRADLFKIEANAHDPRGRLKPVAWPKSGFKHLDRWVYRVDPPVDPSYWNPLQLLCLLPEHRQRLVNRAEVLFGMNEKFAQAATAGLMPPSLVASRKEDLIGFLKSSGRGVLKPLHLAQSREIEVLDARDARAIDTLEAATGRWARPVLLQKFLPEIARGEQRLWFVNGRLLGHLTKHPLDGDFRVDLDRGSRVSLKPLDARERKAAKAVAVLLKRHKVHMAAVDLIGGWVTDFNVTSPGLLLQIEQISGKNLARPTIEGLT